MTPLCYASPCVMVTVSRKIILYNVNDILLFVSYFKTLLYSIKNIIYNVERIMLYEKSTLLIIGKFTAY